MGNIQSENRKLLLIGVTVSLFVAGIFYITHEKQEKNEDSEEKIEGTIPETKIEEKKEEKNKEEEKKDIEVPEKNNKLSKNPKYHDLLT